MTFSGQTESGLAGPTTELRVFSAWAAESQLAICENFPEVAKLSGRIEQRKAGLFFLDFPGFFVLGCC
jgi:hypothetical protein